MVRLGDVISGARLVSMIPPELYGGDTAVCRSRPPLYLLERRLFGYSLANRRTHPLGNGRPSSRDQPLDCSLSLSLSVLQARLFGGRLIKGPIHTIRRGLK